MVVYGAERTSMGHLHKKDPEALTKLLPNYSGGQCVLFTSANEMYRGPIKTIFVILYNPKHAQIRIAFPWLCVCINPNPRDPRHPHIWKNVPLKKGESQHVMLFDYAWHYVKPEHDSELKIQAAGESLHLFHARSRSNISQIMDE